MTQDLTRCIVRILTRDGKTAGTGFLAGDCLAVTCAHVVDIATQKHGPGAQVTLVFTWQAGQTLRQKELAAEVLEQGWSPTAEEDVAFLRLSSMPEQAAVVRLGSAKFSGEHACRCLGYPRAESGESEWSSRDTIAGLLADRAHPRLQIQSDVVRRGYSGSPLLDLDQDRVVGMVTWGRGMQQDLMDRFHTGVVHAVPADTLQRLWPELVLEEERSAAAELLPEGHLPPGSRMPHLRNAAFTGREADLLALADDLLNHSGATVGITAASSPTPPLPGVISGQGGIGKSQLAVEFCYRYGRFLAGVHWVPAAEPASIPAEIAACGVKLGIQPWPDSTDEKVEATLRAWRSEPNRLVVLDNLEDEAALRRWLPELDGLRVLLTTRRSAWPRGIDLRLRPLDVLPREESMALLKRLAPRLGHVEGPNPPAPFPTREGGVDTNERHPSPRRGGAGGEVLSALAARLGDLPLALDLAGRYLDEAASLSAGDYLEALSGEGLLHDSLADWTHHSPTAHAASLAKTFELSYDRLDENVESDRLARRIFWAAGYCAPNQPIPPEVLRGAALEEGQNPVLFDRGLRRLAELGLLKVGEAGPSIHPLLAEFARLVEEEGAFGRLVGALIDKAYKAHETGLPDPYRPLRPHLEAAAAWTETKETSQAAELLSGLAGHLWQVAEYGRAKALFERALRIDEQVYGPEHHKVAIRANNLGMVLQALGDLAGAKELYERALRIDEQVYGPEHPKVAIRANNLGMVLKDLGDLAGARAHIERALRIDEAVYGPEHRQVAIFANNLGMVLKDLGDLAGAKEHIERALRIDEKVYGLEHPNVAIRASNLGSVLQDLGDLAGAKALFEQALRIDEQVYGPEHPNVATVTNNLGMVLLALGNLAGAKTLYERALRIDEQVYGPEHPNVARDANNLGSVLQDLGDLAGAREHIEQALRIDVQVYGPEHPTVAAIASNLGLVLQDLGDLDGARAHIERALRIDEQVYGPEHPNVAIRASNLGSVLQDLGDLAGAKELYEQALRIDEKVYGPEHHKVAIRANNLGMVLQALGDLAGAKALYERALRIDEQVYGPEHPQVALFANNLGSVLHDLGDLAGAKELYERALRIDEQVYGPEHHKVAIRANNLGKVLQDLGDLAGARAHIERALTILEKFLPVGHPHIRRAQANLARVMREIERGKD